MRRARFFAIATIGVASLLGSCSSGPPERISNDTTNSAPQNRSSVKLEFLGNEKIPNTDLRTALSALLVDLEMAGVDNVAVEDAVYELTLFYRSQGFPEPQIVGAWSRRDKTATIRLDITEGRRRYLRRLDIEGNEAISLDDLQGCFSWASEGKLGSLAKYVLGVGSEVLGLERAVFTESALRSALSCVESLYRLEGFYFVETTFEVMENPPGQVRVAVQVIEGPRVWVERPIEIDGVESVDENEVREAFGLEERSIFVPRLTLVIRGRVLDYYRTRGYLFAKVDVERHVDRETATATMRVSVKEGERARIRRVVVDGREFCWDSVIERYFEFETGDVYDSDAVRKTTHSLLRSGLFESVTIEPREIEGDPTRVDLRVRVVEKPRYRVALLAGWGSWERLRGGIVLEDTNVFGSGHSVGIEGSTSFRHRRAEIDYLNPHVFHEDLSHEILGFYEHRENPSYTFEEVGSENGLGYRWTQEFRTRLFHVLRSSEVRDATGSVPTALKEDVLLSSANVAFSYDDRSSFVNPQDGSSHRLRFEYAGKALGSDLDFLRPTLSSAWVFPLLEGDDSSLSSLRLVPAIELGGIFKLSGTDTIPLPERFFSGGETSIRSFGQDEAGPKRGGDPIGGESFVTLHLELRQSLGVMPMLDGLDGAIFADAGSIEESVDDFGGGRWLFGVGFGFRYNTPVGPLRVDFAFNPDRAPGEDLFVFHFGLGYPF